MGERYSASTLCAAHRNTNWSCVVGQELVLEVLEAVMRALLILGFLVLLGVGAFVVRQWMTPGAGSTPEITAEQRAELEAQINARAAAGKARLDEQSQTLAKQIAEWNSEFPLVGTSIGDGGVVIITVESGFSDLPYEERLTLTSKCQELWAAIYSPRIPDDAYVVLKDAEGNELAGSDRVTASKVWAQKPKQD